VCLIKHREIYTYGRTVVRQASRVLNHGIRWSVVCLTLRLLHPRGKINLGWVEPTVGALLLEKIEANFSVVQPIAQKL
jgi:hypothetical protein